MVPFINYAPGLYALLPRVFLFEDRASSMSVAVLLMKCPWPCHALPHTGINTWHPTGTSSPRTTCPPGHKIPSDRGPRTCPFAIIRPRATKEHFVNNRMCVNFALISARITRLGFDFSHIQETEHRTICEWGVGYQGVSYYPTPTCKI